jgi:hypothetical protein
MLAVKVHPALSDVRPELWDAVVPPGRGGLLHAFLAPCARVLDDGRWRVFTVTDGDGQPPVAVSPGVIHRVDLAAWLPAVPGRAVQLARHLRGELLRPRVLELGPPCWPGPPVACVPSVPAGTAASMVVQEAWRQVAVERQADALLVRDFGGDWTPLEGLLDAWGFVKLAERPTFVVPIAGRDLAAHVAAMRAPYRRRAQQYLGGDLSGGDELRVSLVSGAAMAARADAIAQLCALTTNRSTESRREQVGPDVIAGWSTCDRARTLLIEDQQGVLLLAAVVLIDPPVVHFIRVGFGEEVGKATGVYPRLLYELVRLAAAEGCAFVDLGLTSADPKLRAGARPVPLRVWARHRNPVVQKLLRAAMPRLPGQPPGPERNVFRDPPAALQPAWYGEGGP